MSELLYTYRFPSLAIVPVCSCPICPSCIYTPPPATARHRERAGYWADGCYEQWLPLPSIHAQQNSGPQNLWEHTDLARQKQIPADADYILRNTGKHNVQKRGVKRRHSFACESRPASPLARSLWTPPGCCRGSIECSRCRRCSGPVPSQLYR